MKEFIMNVISKYSAFRDFYSGCATILMLHRVAPIEPNQIWPIEHLKVSPGFLESYINALIDQDYSFISLDQLHSLLASNKDFGKKIVFTLDDGYKDNYEVAYPIFKKYQIPFTVYITSALPDYSARIWWYALGDLLANHSDLYLGGINYACQTTELKVASYFAISEKIRSLNNSHQSEIIEDFFKTYDIDWPSYCKSLSLSWEQIEALAADPLVTIGSHTASHPVLSKLSPLDFVSEVQACNSRIEEKIHQKPQHFAYPFGTRFEVLSREFELIKQFSFRTSTTTRVGNIFKGHRSNLHALPRIMLTENSKISDLYRPRLPRFRAK